MEVKMMTSNNELITKKDLRKIFWRSLPMEFSWNYERQMHYKEIWNSLTVLCMLQRLLVVL